MCGTCGCGSPDSPVSIQKPGAETIHSFSWEPQQKMPPKRKDLGLNLALNQLHCWQLVFGWVRKRPVKHTENSPVW